MEAHLSPCYVVACEIASNKERRGEKKFLRGIRLKGFYTNDNVKKKKNLSIIKESASDNLSPLVKSHR